MKWELIPSHSFDKWLWILHLIWKLVIVFVFLPYLPNCHSRRLHRADAFHFSIIFFQREWQFAPWCAFTMFWLLLTAVVGQRASWPECLAGETVLSQQWMSRRLPHHEDPPSGDHDEDGAKILSKRLFLKTKTMKDLPYTGSIISGCLNGLNRVTILNDGNSCFQEPEEDQGDSTIPSLSFLSTARIDSQKWIYLILFQSVKLK